MKQCLVTEAKPNSLNNWLTFLLPSLIGLLLFVVPVHIDGSFTVPIAWLASGLKSLLIMQLPFIITVIVSFSGIMTIITKLFRPQFIIARPFFVSLFGISPLWALIRVIGMIFVLLSFFNAGPNVIWSDSTGGMVLNELMPTLCSVFILAGFFLPLLMNFGLLELIGALMTRIMRPVFNLPGRSAIDCIASWLGDGSVGILMTSKQFENSYYTEREAAVIGTTFSVVSITFSLVITAQVGLEHVFSQLYLTVCFSGLIAALIVPRLPPLSQKKDVFICGKSYMTEYEVIPSNCNVFKWGLQQALQKVAKIQSKLEIIGHASSNAIDMVIGVLPAVMAIGTTALIITEYTPIFEYMGIPFLPLLEYLQIPEAQAASKTMMVGFSDMFVPSILATSIEHDMTRFVIAALSLTQLIYLSEVGAILLGSKIPITLLELFIIFILRTLVTLPIISVIAHVIF